MDNRIEEIVQQIKTLENELIDELKEKEKEFFIPLKKKKSYLKKRLSRREGPR